MAFIDAATLKATYPDEFCTVPDATVEIWLTQAERIVGENWCGDRTHDLATLAAHYLTVNGLGTSGKKFRERMDKGVKSMRSGSVQITYMDATKGGGAGDAFYGQTRYGQMFLPQLKICRGGPLVTGTGTFPYVSC